MKQYAKDALWFCLGCVFLLTLIPPALIIASVALISGHMERE